MARGLEGGLPPLASPDTARDYIYVTDVCDAYMILAANTFDPGSVFNLGTGVQTTLRQAVAAARQVLGIALEPTWKSMPDRGWDTSTWVADSSLIKERIGWSPKVNLKQGLRLTADWLRDNPDLKYRYRSASS